jgi:hypothetical protein
MLDSSRPVEFRTEVCLHLTQSMPRRENHHLQVTLRIRTCRICRAVRAFDPSGVQVNSAESDSAVGCKHGEFESSHGQVSSLLARQLLNHRGRTRPREFIGVLGRSARRTALAPAVVS